MKKVAIVTGGSRGIGKSICEKLANIGYDVVLNYNNSEDSAKEIKNLNNNIEIYKANLENFDELKGLVNFTFNKFGRIDLLVNNAGIDIVKPFQDFSRIEFEKIMNVNLFSAFYLCQLVANYMINQKSGCIINVSSVWGKVGASCEVPYSISKAGLNGLTKSLAKELGPSNIRVNAVMPGFIDTDMNSTFSDEEINDIVCEIPLGRIGKPSEVADSVTFLADSSYITGEILEINGGWNI